MNVRLVITKDYRKNHAFGALKNKANSKPISNRCPQNPRFWAKNKDSSKIEQKKSRFCPNYAIFSPKNILFPYKVSIENCRKRKKLRCKTHKRNEKYLKRSQIQLKKGVYRMSWNLFEKIINAVKPKESHQVSDTSESWPENQPQPEIDAEQQESSEEPSPSHQEKLSAIHQGEYHD